MSGIEAVHIFDEHNTLVISHTYTSRPPPASQLISAYLSHASPRPSLLHLPSLNPPCQLHALTSDSLLFLAPSTTDVPPLSTLEFLHRLSDALSSFLGSPLLPSKIESNYALCAQLLSELCDEGQIALTEPDALRDAIEPPMSLSRFLGLPNAISPAASTAPVVPWRRTNVRHTSNELYVDMLESVSATFAPSGRALAAFSRGSIAFTAHVSGVPDLLLTLTTATLGSLPAAMKTERLQRVIQRPVFHPCVRLARWREFGELSFVPPDGRFVLAGYEADLLDDEAEVLGDASLPVSARVSTTGNEFEVRVEVAERFVKQPVVQQQTGPKGLAQVLQGEARGPELEELKVFVPLPAEAGRKVPDLRPSKGEAHFSATEGGIIWTFSSKVVGSMRSAVLRGSVTRDSTEESTDAEEKTKPTTASAYMPRCVNLSFSVRGWLASGLKVDSLTIDTKRSRGLGEGVKPYKGVKYLTVSKDGVEVRC